MWGARILGAAAALMFWALASGKPKRIGLEGIYWDTGRADRPTTAARLALCQRLGLTEVCVELTPESEPTAVRWSIDQWREFVAIAREHGIEVSIMVWPRPTAAWVRWAKSALPAYVVDGVWAIEADVEGRWRVENLDGYGTLTAAAGKAIEALRAAAAGRCQVGLTTYPYGVTGRAEDFVRSVDYVAVQAYSRYKASDSAADRQRYAIGGDLGPGNMQPWAADRTVAAGARSVVIDLAAYSQQWPAPAPSPVAAMQTAYTAARLWFAQRGLTPRIRWWSGKQIWGRAPNRYVVEFLTQRAKVA